MNNSPLVFPFTSRPSWTTVILVFSVPIGSKLMAAVEGLPSLIFKFQIERASYIFMVSTTLEFGSSATILPVIFPSNME